MNTDGWYPWTPYGLGPQQVPWSYETVEMMRVGWDRPVTGNPSHLPLEMNVADLWWRPVGDLKPAVDIQPVADRGSNSDLRQALFGGRPLF